MKMQFEVTSIAGAKRAQEVLGAYIKSVNEPAAAMAVRERLAGPQIHPLKKAKGNGRSSAWTPAKRAAQSRKLKAAHARRRMKARAA